LSSESRHLSLLHCLCIRLQSLALFLLDSLIDLDTDNLRQSTVDLALTISRKTSIGVGNIMPKEKDIKEHGKKE
jgi:hypothetical protein